MNREKKNVLVLWQNLYIIRITFFFLCEIEIFDAYSFYFMYMASEWRLHTHYLLCHQQDSN